MEEPECFMCGGPMSANPHPDAGKPERLTSIGAAWVCIPCCMKACCNANSRFRLIRSLLSTKLIRKCVDTIAAYRRLFPEGCDGSTAIEALRKHCDETDSLFMEWEL